MALDIGKVFAGLRDNELKNNTDDLNLLGEVENVIKHRDDFILGSFIYSHRDSNKIGFWPDNDPPLFYGNNSSINGEFVDNATETFNTLREKELFLSTYLHEMDSKRAKRVELVHKDDVQECLAHLHFGSCGGACDDHWHEDWAIKNTLKNLYEIFNKQEIQDKIKIYSEIITGYFPSPKNNYLIVYCPFLVPDGKPPGNFFGIFECTNRCADILALLGNIQLAGTLIFSRMAVDAKQNKIKREVGRLRELYGQIVEAGHVIGNLEAIINPNTLIAGDEPWKKLRETFTSFFEDKMNHDVSSWNEETIPKFGDVIVSSKTDFGQLKSMIGNELYNRCFATVDTVFGHARAGYNNVDVKKAGFILKAACRNGQCPTSWMGHQEDNKHIALRGSISPLSFIMALHNSNVKPSFNENSCEINISVPSIPDMGDLNLLETAIKSKMEGTKGIAFYDGHTSSKIAVLACAAGNGNAVIRKSRSFLELDLVFKIGETK